MTDSAENTEKKELKVEDIRKMAEEKRCPVQKALYYMEEFYAGPMCNRCHPCSLGSYEAQVRIRKIIDGEGEENDLRALKYIMDEMLLGSMCKKGKDTAQFVMQWMESGVFREHIEGRCPDMECKAFIEYRIIPEKCIMCGLCKDVCDYAAIFGEKAKPYHGGYQPYEIRQKKCTKCDACPKVCPTDAIIIVQAKVKKPVGV